MHFIQITESVTTEEVTCKVNGLTSSAAETMETVLRDVRINYSRRGQECIEAETAGLTVMNILGSFDYRVYGQSMVIEVSHVGGRNVMVHKLVWTMGK